MRQLLVLTAIVGVLGATEARAQDRGGVRAGFNSATLTTDETGFDPKSRTGLVVGLFGVVPVNEVFAFQPEVLYSQQGATVEEGSNKATVKLDYVQIPLLARVRLGHASPAHLLVGPSFGIRTRAETEFNGETQSFESDVKKGDVGIVTGAAVNVGPVVIDGRYTWGLTNLNNNNSEPGTSKNRVFSLSAGLRF